MIKTRNKRALNYEGGFTLMEILISMSIVSIIMVIILQAFSLSNKAWQVGEKRVDEFQRTRIIIDQINRELRGAYPFKFFQNSEEFENKDCSGNIEFNGESDRLSFITSERSLSTLNYNFGFRAVTYYIDDDSGTDEEGLVVMENIPWSPNPFDEGIIVELDSSVVDIQFEYYICLKESLDSSEDEECEWIEVWNPCEESDMGLEIEELKKVKTTIPEAVRITMTVKRETKSSGFDDYEEVELTPIIIPIYTDVQSTVNPFRSNSNQGGLVDLLTGRGGTPSTDLKGNSLTPGRGEALLSPNRDDPQRAAELLRQLLSGELKVDDRK